jgi:hypothetical protein
MEDQLKTLSPFVGGLSERSYFIGTYYMSSADFAYCQGSWRPRFLLLQVAITIE